MLFRRAHRNDQAGTLQQALPNRTGGHLLQAPGVPVLRHRGRLWVLVLVIAGGAAAEWLRHPGSGWVLASWATVPLGIAALWPLRGWRRWTLALLLLAQAVSLTVIGRELSSIETRWPEERERRITAAYERLQGDTTTTTTSWCCDLHSALLRAQRLAEAATASPP